MAIIHNPSVTRDGLVFYIDAANPKSYPNSGTSHSDMMRGSSGTLTNSPIISNGAVVFDGTNSFSNFGNTFTALDLTSKSCQAWIRRTGTTGSQGILDKGFGTTAPNYGGWGFWVNTNNKLWFWNHPSLDLQDNGSLSIQNGVWTNIAITYDYPTSTASFYINGVLNSVVSNPSIVEKASGSANLIVGGVKNGGSFNGAIGPLKAYNKVLSLAEIQQNYVTMRSRFNV